MKLSSDTIAIIKNFSSINQNLFVAPGNTIKTISDQKTVMATAVIPDTFESELRIYDANQFLNVISLFNNPEFELTPNHVNISSGRSSVKYYYADRSMITVAPEKDLKLPDVFLQFSLPTEVLKSTLQAGNVLQSPNWSVMGNGTNIILQVGDVKNNTSNVFEVVVGDTDMDFKLVFKAENLRMMLNNYNVQISSKGISQFSTEDGKLVYFIATESK
jgi:hypothetical protein